MRKLFCIFHKWQFIYYKYFNAETMAKNINLPDWFGRVTSYALVEVALMMKYGLLLEFFRCKKCGKIKRIKEIPTRK